MSKKKDKKKKETLENIKPKKKLDSGYYHEYLERAYLAGNILDTVLVEHSVHEKHPVIQDMVCQILEDIGDLYQLAGNLLYAKETEEEAAENEGVKKD